MTTLRRNHMVVRRSPGAYEEGRYVPGPVTPDTILASVQPATNVEYSRVQATLEGRMPSTLLRVYTNSRLAIHSKDEHPGDLLQYNGESYVIIAEALRDVLQGSPVSHNRYLALSLRDLE